MSIDEKDNASEVKSENTANPETAAQPAPAEQNAQTAVMEEAAVSPVAADSGDAAGDQQKTEDKPLQGAPLAKKGGDIDLLYFVGCTASFDINVKDVGINTVNILDALGIKFGILGDEEKCCGSIALRIGDYKEFERLSKYNIQLFNALNVKTFLTSCSGCYKTVKHDYKKMGILNMEVYHTAEFLAKLIREKKIELKHEVPVRITYHDPCHMGRHSNVYDPPREVLRAIPGLEFVEMERSGQYSRCCGAGGGLKAGYPDTQNLMSQQRAKDAEEVKADWFVTTCPFCYQGLQIGINAIQSKLKMKDITEVVAIAMGIKPFEK